MPLFMIVSLLFSFLAAPCLTSAWPAGLRPEEPHPGSDGIHGSQVTWTNCQVNLIYQNTCERNLQYLRAVLGPFSYGGTCVAIKYLQVSSFTSPPISAVPQYSRSPTTSTVALSTSLQPCSWPQLLMSGEYGRQDKS